MYSAALENLVTFPQVPGARRGKHRFEVSGLYAPFEDLGEVALSALHSNDNEVVGAGEATIDFLRKLTRFMLGDGHAQQGRAEACAPGDHTFEYQFADRAAGRRAARRGIELTADIYPVSRLVVGYSVPHDRGCTMPMGDVQIRVDIEDHPRLAGHYGRLSGGVSQEAEPQCTLRAALSDVTHQGLLVPDMYPTIYSLASIASKFEGVQGTRVG
jgi:hypothetical protein